MKVLVTGGAGYIGSHTAQQLARAGHEPIVFDNLSRGHAWAVRWGPLEQGDLADAAAIRTALDRHQVDAVIHFAALALVGESMTRPEVYFRTNAVGSLNLLDAIVASGIRPIVFSSTCATYGNPIRVPIDEQHPQAPVNPYGESKLLVERTLRWYGDAHGLPWAALRYFNASGADPAGEIGEDHDPETHLIPLVIGAALGTRPPVSIFGTDYPTDDGTAIRDYIHVVDLADAHLAALARLGGGGPSGAFNLGTGGGHSVREVIAAVERVGGRAVPRIDAPRRAGDPPVLVADARQARAALGWQPRYADLDVIVEHAWRWHTRTDRPR